MLDAIRERIDRIMGLRLAYRRMFIGPREELTPDGQTVLADLKRFARHGKPPVEYGADGHHDPMRTGIRIGRQEVVQRLVEMLHLDDATLVNLTGSPDRKTEENPDE